MDFIVWYNMYIIINDTLICCTADQRNPKQMSPTKLGELNISYNQLECVV